MLVYDLKCVSEAYLKLATEVIQRERELEDALIRMVGKAKCAHQLCFAVDRGGHGAKRAFTPPYDLTNKVEFLVRSS